MPEYEPEYVTNLYYHTVEMGLEKERAQFSICDLILSNDIPSPVFAPKRLSAQYIEPTVPDWWWR